MKRPEEEIFHKDTLEKGKKIVAYHKFPSRIIVKSPFQKRINVSYGIIAYAWDTRRWLMVQHKHTLPFINILQGSYRNSELPFFLQGVTVKELELLREMSLNSFNFNTVFFRIFSKLSVEDEIYAKERFFANGPLFLRYISSEGQPTNPGWMFPKGFTHTIRENPVDCALRNFKEETGLDITRQEKSFFGRDPFCETNVSESNGIGSFQQRYETRCWLVIFMKEKHISLKPQHGKKLWLTEKESIELLDTQKQRILLEAKELIKENFLF